MVLTGAHLVLAGQRVHQQSVFAARLQQQRSHYEAVFDGLVFGWIFKAFFLHSRPVDDIALGQHIRKLRCLPHLHASRLAEMQDLIGHSQAWRREQIQLRVRRLIGAHEPRQRMHRAAVLEVADHGDGDVVKRGAEIQDGEEV